jgi:serine/threonine protein kinase
LSALSSLLGELQLNINEAHAFCTDDGLALDVFVVDGWHAEEAEELQAELRRRLALLDAQAASVKAAPGEDKEAEAAAATAAALQPLQLGGGPGEDWELDTAKLQFLEKVASGSFGDLFRGCYNGQEVAIKVLRLAEHSDQAHMIREFMQELAGACLACPPPLAAAHSPPSHPAPVLRKVRHKHIVQLIGASTCPPKLCIVTEFMRRGSLLDYLHRHHPLRPQTQGKLALDVAKGMDYLHRCCIIHRDLKAANLLMNEHGDCKVADFGVARVVDAANVMTAETGTYRWMAPEVVSHQRYDSKCDVFSFGILLWELVTGGAVPYAGFTPLQAAVGVVQKGLRPTIPEGCHPVLARVMASCWAADPAARPDFARLMTVLEAVASEPLPLGSPHASDADDRTKQPFRGLFGGGGKRK